MKRSEAEAAFLRVIKEYKVSGFGASSELASRLITLAMNIGMLPPKHPTKRVTEISLLRPAYIWEPETKEKEDKQDDNR